MHSSNVGVNYSASGGFIRHTSADYEYDHSIRVYECCVPPFVAVTLRRLYSSMYGSLERIISYHNPEAINTYVASNGAEIKTLILYKRYERQIVVLNRYYSLSKDQLSRFSDFVFSRYGDVVLIHCPDLESDVGSFPYSYLKHGSSHVRLIEIDSMPDPCRHLFWPEPRQSIVAAEFALKISNPSFEVSIVKRADIDLGGILEVASLRKKWSPLFEIPETSKLSSALNSRALLTTYGILLTARIEGIICGAAVSFVVGGRQFFPFISCDPAYDEYLLKQFIFLKMCLCGAAMKVNECWLMDNVRNIPMFAAKKSEFFSFAIFRTGHGPHPFLHLFGP